MYKEKTNSKYVYQYAQFWVFYMRFYNWQNTYCKCKGVEIRVVVLCKNAIHANVVT